MKKSILLIATIALASLSSPVRINAYTWSFLPVGYGRDVGQFTSLAFNSQGSWVVAYNDLSARTLRWSFYHAGVGGGYTFPATVMQGGFGVSAVLSDAEEISLSHTVAGKLYFCNRKSSSWISTQVENSHVNIGDTGLMIDADGNPWISYCKTGPSSGLWYARRNGSKWSMQRIDAGAYAVYNQMTVDHSGNPVIAYSDASHGDAVVDTLKVARWNGSAWNISVVPEVGGRYPTVACDPVTGNLAVAHWDASTGQLRFLSWNGEVWTTGETVDTAPSITGCSLAIRADGTVYLAYGSAEMRFATRDPNGGGWTPPEIVDSTTTGSLRNSLKISPLTGPNVVFRGLPQNGYESGVLKAKQIP